MSIVNENLLSLRYHIETGHVRPQYTPVSEYGEYVNWLEEKVSELLQKEEDAKNAPPPIVVNYEVKT